MAILGTERGVIQTANCVLKPVSWRQFVPLFLRVRARENIQ